MRKREKIKQVSGRVSRKARSYAKYFIVFMAFLLFLSVFRASIFDRYLFSWSDLTHDLEDQNNLVNRLRQINPEIADLFVGAEYREISEDVVDVYRDGAFIARLESDDDVLYVVRDGQKTAAGFIKEENGRINVYANITPESEKIWFEISFILLLAISAEFLVNYVKQPAVMVLLLLGIIISPSAISTLYPPIASALTQLFISLGVGLRLTDYMPHLVPVGEGSFISIFAKLGSIFLLFGVGLHSEISKVFNKRNFFVALVGVVAPFIGGFGYAIFSGYSFAYSMFLGAALTATSVGVTVAVLQEFKVLDREYSKIILGAAVIDDILSLLVLSLVKNMPETTALDFSSLYPFLTVLVMAFIYVVGGIRMGEYLVKKLFNREEDNLELSKITLLGVLVYLLSYSYVAEIIGLSAIVGAFLAGVTLNYSRHIEKIVKQFYSLEALFTPIFFVSLGMYVDIDALVHNIEPILVITLIAVATKVVGCGLAAKSVGASLKDSLIVGVGMVPRGEVALIIGFYGLITSTASGEPVLTAAEYAAIASMSFLTTVIVPPILQKILK